MKRWFFKILRGGFFALVCLATLVALVIAEENWRGQRDWEAYQRELVARGDRIDPAAFSAPVPDEQNVAMTPVFKKLLADTDRPAEEISGHELSKLLADLVHPANEFKLRDLGDWRSGEHLDLTAWIEYFGERNILQALKKVAPEMNEIGKAVCIPNARFPVMHGGAGAKPQLPFRPLLWLGTLFSLRAQVALGEGQTDIALQDIQTIFRLADAVQAESTMLAQMFAVLLRYPGAQAVWEGMTRHQWSESQLAALQTDFQKADILTTVYRSFQGEQTFSNGVIEKWRMDKHAFEEMGMAKKGSMGWAVNLHPLVPRSFFFQNALNINRYFEHYVFPTINLTERRISPQMVRAASEYPRMMAKKFIFYPYPYNVFLASLMHSSPDKMEIIAATQSVFDEGAVACALERYWLAQGKYPETLDTLVPQYFQKLPHDVISGEPLKYRRAGEGYRLYSIGWNEKDDGGDTVNESTGGAGEQEADWVWSIPAR